MFSSFSASNLQYSVLDSELSLFETLDLEFEHGFNALALSISQFDMQTRINVYENLPLNSCDQDCLENAHRCSDEYEAILSNYLLEFSKKTHVGDGFELTLWDVYEIDPMLSLHLMADFLEMRLMVVHCETPQLYSYLFSEKQFNIRDYDCFQSETCRIFADSLNLFKVESETVFMRVTTESIAIQHTIIKEAERIEWMIKDAFCQTDFCEVASPYDVLIRRYSQDSFDSVEAALLAFNVEISKLGDIIPEIKEEVGAFPLAIIWNNGSDYDQHYFSSVDIQKLAVTQRNFREHQVQKLSSNIFSKNHHETLQSLSCFLTRKDRVQDIVFRYNSEQDEDEKAALIEDEVNHTFYELDKYTRVEKTDVLLSNISDDFANLYQHLYYTLFGSDFDADSGTLEAKAKELFKVGLDCPELPSFVSNQLNPIGVDVLEKTSDAMLSEFVSLNQSNETETKETGDLHSTFKQEIDAIRIKIAEIKGISSYRNCAQGNDVIHILAELCVAIEKEFHIRPRDTQILAVLALLNTGKNHLVEVKTGEGKTIIVAMMAVIFIKRGRHVDIITSSKTLSHRDFEKFEMFYRRFEIESSCNCSPSQKEVPGEKNCYKFTKPKIVYGDSQTFQADKLNNDFYRKGTFAGRVADVVLVDEVDSSLIDKASWVCQISDSVGGMSTLSPLLSMILRDVGLELTSAVEKSNTPPVHPFDDTVLMACKETVLIKHRNNLGAYFAGGQAISIPSHLHHFVTYRLKFWVDSAVLALFQYENNKHYVASKLEKKIIPIDFENTGEWEDSLQYEDGLHYFLNLLNNFESEPENLTKPFISSMMFFKSYPTLYGLSGTLGGSGVNEEYDAFNKVYGCGITKIPTFAVAPFNRLPDCLAETRDQWKELIYQDIQEAGGGAGGGTVRKRATLVICKTKSDVEGLKTFLLGKGIFESNIVTFTNGKEDKSGLEQATSGKIIIATNLAGRGMDIEAEGIEDYGGLHVIVAFLPINERVEVQAFGRTSRKGLSGTGRRIFCYDELRPIHCEQDEDGKLVVTTDSIDMGRKKVTYARLSQFIETETEHLKLKDDFFNDFKRYYHGISARLIIRDEFCSIRPSLLSVYEEYVLDEWSIYLDQVNKGIKEHNISHFISTLSPTLESVIDKNELYAIQFANALLDVPADDRGHELALNQAGAIYDRIAAGNSLSSGFALYNKVFIAVARDPSDFNTLKSILKSASEKFKANPFYTSIIEANKDISEPKKKLSSPMFRLLKAMALSSEAVIRQIEGINTQRLKSKFLNPFELKESSAQDTESKEEKKEEVSGEKLELESIPSNLIQEAIKFGLKGPLKLEAVSDGVFWAILMAIGCVALAIAAIVVMIVTAGAATGLVAMGLGALIGAVFGAAVDGAINAIKGAVNDNFSWKSFGQEVATGAVSGLLGGAVAGGLTTLASATLKTTSTLARVGIMGGIGAASGVVGGGTGYLVGAGFSGQKVTWSDFGKAVLNGAVGGAIGGGVGGAMGLSNVGAVVLGDAAGAAVGGAAVQGIQIAMGDRDHFDGFELLEGALKAGVNGGIMARAHKAAATQAKKRSQDPVVNTKKPTKKQIKQFDELLKRVNGHPERRIDAFKRRGLLLEEGESGVGFQIKDGHMEVQFKGRSIELDYIYGDCVEQAILFQEKVKRLQSQGGHTDQSIVNQASAYANNPKNILKKVMELNSQLSGSRQHGEIIRGHKRKQKSKPLSDLHDKHIDNKKFKEVWKSVDAYKKSNESTWKEFEIKTKTKMGWFSDVSFRSLNEAINHGNNLTPKQIELLLSNKNQTKLGEKRVHALNRALDGYLSIDLQNDAAIRSQLDLATKINPGAYRVLYQIEDLKLKFIGLVDTHSGAKKWGTHGVKIGDNVYPGFLESYLAGTPGVEIGDNVYPGFPKSYFLK